MFRRVYENGETIWQKNSLVIFYQDCPHDAWCAGPHFVCRVYMRRHSQRRSAPRLIGAGRGARPRSHGRSDRAPQYAPRPRRLVRREGNSRSRRAA